jgi:hypothetical protein
MGVKLAAGARNTACLCGGILFRIPQQRLAAAATRWISQASQ